MGEKESYTVAEAVKILNMSRDRIYEYLRTGNIRGWRVTPRGAWRIHHSELERIMRTAFRPRDQANLQSTIAPVLTDEDIKQGRAPALRFIYYNQQTGKGHALVIEEGVKKQISVGFDPYKLVWKPRIK